MVDFLDQSSELKNTPDNYRIHRSVVPYTILSSDFPLSTVAERISIRHMVPNYPFVVLSSGGSPSPAPQARYLMRGTRTAPPAGPVTWVATGVPDYSGTQYPDGPGALNLSTIVTAAVLTSA